eukprot:CAMPEP_0170355156 /NCGR_PEP_ID=MMETSP0117_2-20130122/494_1 /TAXON_ID=400756 /ORGANISM="Durinskia baltica, Strain CSIRO CS-38" /LENGTH=385 /DNA_ID=CAMNT_0010609179 /DNA_START=218 /DNA_END=1375 /DNA_ORIENTATION=+
MPGVISNEDNFRCPQRVCDACFSMLRDIQEELRQAVSRANQDTVVADSSKVPNLPSVDFYLEKEIQKATAMLYSFKNSLGEEKIPRELLDIAKGVVFFTIIKVGFMFTGRYGTGLIVAKLPDGSWSAPSAVQMSGVGWGLQVGAELTDVMLILSTDSAVHAFKSRGQVSVGAELGVSVGPVGRSIESDVTAGSKGAAHAFSYAQSKGLFVGASLEASGIAARPDVNRTFYGEKVSISALLQGDYPRPRGANILYKALEEVLYRGPPSPPVRQPRVIHSSLADSNDNLDSNNSSNMSNGSSAGEGPGTINKNFTNGKTGSSATRTPGANGGLPQATAVNTTTSATAPSYASMAAGSSEGAFVSAASMPAAGGAASQRNGETEDVML